MKTNLWKLLTAVVVLGMLAAGLAACGTPAPPPPPPPEEAPTATPPPPAPTPTPTEVPEPVTMRIGTTWIWEGPNVGTAVSNWALWRLIFDSVVETGALGTYVPGLAESWSGSEDATVWTFKIRDGVTFQDGTPCTAEDVAWSLNWMITVGNDSLSYMWWMFDEVVALDDTTLQITTSQPVSYMEYLMFWAFIVPRSVWGEIDNYDDMADFQELVAATASGPYKATEWVADEYLILDANEDYWGGKPAIDQIIFQQYATEDAMVQALLAGEIDFIDVVPATAVQTLEDAENVKVEIMEGIAVDELTINSYEGGTQPASLGDPVVRLAMEYAIDREQINEVAHLGYGTPATAMIAPALGDWHNSDIEAIPFDTIEGNRVLDDAGYVDSDGDGVREWTDGSPLHYRLMSDDAATSARMMEIIAAGLEEVGISTELIAVDYDSQLNQVFWLYDFDLNYWWWGMDIDPDFAMVIFKCDQIWYWNDSGYCNETFDELYVQESAEMDHDTRRGTVWDMQEMVFNDRPWITLIYRPTISAYRSDRFTGFNPEAKYLYGKWSVLQAEPVR